MSVEIGVFSLAEHEYIVAYLAIQVSKLFYSILEYFHFRFCVRVLSLKESTYTGSTRHVPFIVSFSPYLHTIFVSISFCAIDGTSADVRAFRRNPALRRQNRCATLMPE